MTCKDCYHCKACEEMCDRILNWEEEEICDHFKDKSRIVELPCAVGETVYSFCSDLGVMLPYIVENVSIGHLGKGRKYIFFEANCHNEETDELLDAIDFDFDNIGKTVFLTREQAEGALRKERGK